MNYVVEEMKAILESDDYLIHYGMPRRSGRYPYGSGEDPYQHSRDFLGRVEEMRKSGFTYVDEDGTPLTLVDKDTYKCAPERTIKRTSDGKMVNVMSGDTCLIGKVTQTQAEVLSEDEEEVTKG